MILPLLIALAGLLGAAGMILLALAAHAAAGTGLDSAGTVLVFHAAATIAAASAIRQGLAHRCLGLAACVGFLLGSALFGADITLRALAGHRLFPMAAPTGGTLMIVSWLLLAAAGLLAMRRGKPLPPP